MMSNNTLAATRPAALSQAERPTVKILRTILLVLPLLSMPAFASHLHHLWYNNSNWQDQDLTAMTGGATSYGAGVAAFYTTPNQELHVYYADTNGYIHQLYYKGTTWSDQNLTALTGAPLALVGGLSGFAIGNLQYLFYVTVDQHVHELNYNNVNWTDTDVTSLGNGVLANPVISAFPTKPNNQLHIYYQDSNAHDMHQLYFNGSSWSDSDLTSATGAYCPGGQWWFGLATGNLQHIVCAGYGAYSNNLDLLHIHYNNYTWVYQDITFRAGGSELPIFPDSGVAGFAASSQGHIYAVTNDSHVHQFTYDSGQWISLDLSATIGAPDKTYGGIAAFRTTPNGQFHIFYAPNSDIYQLYFNGTAWSVQNLTGGGGQANFYADITGFAIGNLQHVFYFDTQN
jgi:hypothetical protein